MVAASYGMLWFGMEPLLLKYSKTSSSCPGGNSQKPLAFFLLMACKLQMKACFPFLFIGGVTQEGLQSAAGNVCAHTKLYNFP